MNRMPTNEMGEADAKGAAKTGRATAKRRCGIAVMLIVPLLLLGAGLYYWMVSGGSVGTDNAAVKQDIVSVSAQLVGPVAEVAVHNGEHVKRGQLLFRIDPAPFRVALEQAEAQLSAAQL